MSTYFFGVEKSARPKSKFIYYYRKHETFLKKECFGLEIHI